MSDNIRQDILCQVDGGGCRTKNVREASCSSHPSPSFRCSVCGALATFPEYLICWSCAEWAQDLRESFSLRSSTSLPTGGKIQIEEPSLSGAVSSIFFVGAV